MSVALDTAIYERLTGIEDLSGFSSAAAAQAALIALLATDSDTSKATVHQGNLNDVVSTEENQSDLYPLITFREDGGTPYPMSKIGATGYSIYRFEIWDIVPNYDRIKAADDYLSKLLDFQRGVSPRFTLESGTCYWMEQMTRLQTNYDSRYKASCGIVAYSILEAR